MSDQQNQPSKLHGYKDEVVGAIKENVGYLIGNNQMENEGRQTKEQGISEVVAASAVAEEPKQYTTTTFPTPAPGATTIHYTETPSNPSPSSDTSTSNDPSMIHAYKEKTVGAVQENVGYVIGNERIEAEGKSKRDLGQAELEQAKSFHQEKAAGEQMEGAAKETVGSATNDKKMQAEGTGERLKGEARQKISS